MRCVGGSIVCTKKCNAPRILVQELISYSGTLRSILGLTKIPRDNVPPFLARFENAVDGVPGCSALL